MADELKKCPFCKGKAKISIKSNDNNTCLYAVKCSKCGICQSEYTYNKAEAVFNWNRRQLIENIIDKIKEYQQMIPTTIKKHVTDILNLIEWEEKE